MDHRDIIPYLNKFITVTLDDGSQRSGYVTNPRAIREPVSEDPELDLVNGFFTEQVPLSRVVSVSVETREDNAALPVVDLKKGFSAEKE